MIPITDNARWLMTTGAIAAARLHARGMPVDLPYCINAQSTLKEEMRRIEADAWKLEGGKEWKKKYGSSASLGDDNQARDVLFNIIGLQPPEDSKTKTGKQGIGKDVLEELDHPFVDIILSYKKREKTSNTFLAGIIKETVDGWVHPFFHVCGSAKEEGANTVRTYRTSSSDPNFQNQPVRDPEMGPIIRNAFRAPKGMCIIEKDYSKIEVHANTWYHKDPTMIQYLVDDYDMHGDMARECFILDHAQYSGCLPKAKIVRNVAKSDFVFAGFYGSYWYKMSVNLWKQMRQLKLMLKDGTTFEEHLRTLGITGLGKPPRDRDGKICKPDEGTFAHHIMKVEEAFWKVRFAQYDQWRRDWFEEYCHKGYFDTLAGFHHEGIFRRNEVINTPGQGTASHCKMLALINLIKAVLQKKLRGYPNAEIHDSILSLVPTNEVDDYLAEANEAMVKKVMAAWPWIITPITIEADVSPDGGTWYEKKSRKIPS